MAEVDYGYGDTDYGYGDPEPQQTNSTMANVDYGYGDTDYGYGDPEPEQTNDTFKVEEEAPPKDRRPKRRCSVTKFSLATETPLTAASVINDLRMGLAPEPAAPAAEEDCKSAMTDETGSMDLEYSPSVNNPAPKQQEHQIVDTIKKSIV